MPEDEIDKLIKRTDKMDSEIVSIINTLLEKLKEECAVDNVDCRLVWAVQSLGDLREKIADHTEITLRGLVKKSKTDILAGEIMKKSKIQRENMQEMIELSHYIDIANKEENLAIKK